MPNREYGFKTGDFAEEDIIKIFEKALNKVAKESSDLRVSKGRKKMKIYTGPYGRSTPDAEPPEYDHIYFFKDRYMSMFLQLYPNMETNGRIKFPEEGVVWVLYVSIFDDCPTPKEISADTPTDTIEGYGNKFIHELYRTLPGEKVLLKEYAMGEDRV